MASCAFEQRTCFSHLRNRPLSVLLLVAGFLLYGSGTGLVGDGGCSTYCASSVVPNGLSQMGGRGCVCVEHLALIYSYIPAPSCAFDARQLGPFDGLGLGHDVLRLATRSTTL